MKKNYLLATLITLIFIGDTFAQNNKGGCGSNLPLDAKPYVLERNELLKNAPSGQRVAMQYVPVKFHLVGDDEGKGYFPVAKVLTILCELNEIYDSVGIYFYLWEGINYIPSTYYYTFEDDNRIDKLFNQFNVEVNGTKAKPDIINVYITKTPTSTLCGRSAFTFTNTAHGIIMAQQCSNPGETTFPHEMGHYFNLFHTFQGSGWDPELVTRDPAFRNCEDAGDYFCDTPADPSEGRASCPYSGTATDSRGDLYNPDEDLFMSYFDDICVSRFSNEEKTAMYQVLLNGGRKNLLIHGVPALDQITAVPAQIVPEEGKLDLIPNRSVFTWNSIPNATHYNLVISKYVSGTTFVADIVTTDTTYIVETLKEYTQYYWKVKGFNAGNTCGEYSPTVGFSTIDSADFTGITTDLSADNVILFPNPISGNQTLSLLIEQNQSQEAVIEIIDNKGALVSKEKINLQAGETKYTFNVSSFATGLYIAKINIEGKPVLRKFQVIQ